jgi:hypothetical protein
MSDAFALAWSVLKADPRANIREIGTYSRAYPMDTGGYRHQQATIHPIIARLIRERNQRVADEKGYGEGLSKFPTLVNAQERTHKVETDHATGKPYTTYGPHGMNDNYHREDYSERKRRSIADNEAAGIVPGDRHAGDFVAMAPQAHTSESPRRIGTSPYKTRAQIVQGSPMHQMQEIAPKLNRLPEGLQPEWMEGYREPDWMTNF